MGVESISLWTHLALGAIAQTLQSLAVCNSRPPCPCPPTPSSQDCPSDEPLPWGPCSAQIRIHHQRRCVCGGSPMNPLNCSNFSTGAYWRQYLRPGHGQNEEESDTQYDMPTGESLL